MSTRQILLVVILLVCPLVISPGAVRDFSVGPVARTCEPSKQKTISLRVTTKDGVSVEDLGGEDLIISEDKTAREILKLESRKDQPLSVAVLIDASASQERTLAATRLAAREFVRSILRSDKDRAAVISFTSDATIEQDLTNDLTKLRAAIDRVKFERPLGYIGGGVVLGPVPTKKQNIPGSTAIWDAIWATVDGFHDASGTRRVIVLLTDGEDTSSQTKMRDAIEHAATGNVAIFSIGVADEKYYSLNRGPLEKLSEETGGRAFFPKKVAELERIFLQTTRDLQSQYALTYCAAGSKATKPVKIKIDLKNPALLQLKPRLSYPRYSL